jgi:phage tail tape-measure protein
LLARGSGSGRASATAAARGAGIFGRFLGGVGIGLSAYSLYDDLNTGNYGTVLGDTAGIVSGAFVVAGAATNPIGLAATGISLANIGGDYVDRLVESHGGTRAEGVAAGTLTGAATGAAFGAAIGSIVPGIGTAVGAIAGAVIGGIAGFIGAYW